MRSLLLFSILAFVCTARAQTTNSWIKSTSGDWQEASAWSLGREPFTGDTVIITNQGWKAVAIGPATESRDVAGVILGGYTDSFNVLLLNYAGFGVPVTAGTITVGSNSAITALSSILTVSSNSGPGDLSIFSTFNQGENAIVNAHLINLGDVTNSAAGSGTYNQTNGIVNADEVSEAFGSTFNQFDGESDIGTLWIGTANSTNAGQYTMVDGYLTAGTIQVYRGSFNQTGGSVMAGLGLGAATYTLSAGTLQLPGIVIPSAPYGSRNPSLGGMTANATLLQTGGTNFCDGAMTVFNQRGAPGIPEPFFGPGRYVLSNGVLYVSGTVNSGSPYYDGGGDFEQWGGWHTNNGTRVVGTDLGQLGGLRPSSLTLGGGTLLTANISIDYADMFQSGGTNRVSGEVDVGTGQGDASFTLSGGLLADQNVTIQLTGNEYFDGTHVLFTQSGGTHIVASLLRASGPPPSQSYYPAFHSSTYVLSNGVLNAPNIQIENGANFEHDGGTITTSGLLSLGYGAWNENTTGQQFGQLLLSAPVGSNAIFSLPSSSCIVHFANSSSQVWSNQASLILLNWHGSTSGGGSAQIIFGNSASGLSTSQVGQIFFSNPQGLPSGTYTARILSSGEIVPSLVPFAPSALHIVAISSNRIDLAWTDNSSTETGFKVERGFDGSSFVQIATVLSNVTSFSDAGLSPSTTYYYRVRATNSNGNSPYSNVASATTFGTTCTTDPFNIVGWWKGEGSTADVLGNDNGVWAGYGSTNTYSAGLVGQAFVFDGIHRDRVDLGNPSNLQLQVFTIEAWIKRSDTNQVSFDDDNEDGAVSGQGGMILAYGRTGYGFCLFNSGQLILSKIDVDAVGSAGVVNDTSWHHVAVTKSSSNAVFYIDGAPASSPIPYNTTYTFDTSISIGSRGDTRGGTFLGSIDEPTIYSRVLSASEIAAIYNAGPSGKCPAHGLPQGWFAQDVGSVAIPGNSSFVNGAFQIVGSGNDIWDFHDQFQFAYRIWNGDGEIVARVTRLDNTDPWAKAGVMFRSDLADNSINAFAMFTSQHGAGFQWRTNSSIPTTNTPAAGSVPQWLKLARVGNTFTASVSSDGQNWTQIGVKTVAVTVQAKVGVAVTAHNNAALCEGDFYVRIDVPGAPPQAPVISSLARQSSGSIQLVIQGEVGRTYEVQASSDLFHWVSLATQFDTNGSITIVDTSASSLPHRFYRARAIP